MLGAGCLAGIGLRMSLFVAGPALKDDLLDAGNIGTLAGSTLSAIVGSTLLSMFHPKCSATAPEPEHMRGLSMQ